MSLPDENYTKGDCKIAKQMLIGIIIFIAGVTVGWLIR